MATVTILSSAGTFNAAAAQQVDVVTYITQTATTLSWQTTFGNIVTLTGSGFTYAGGSPTGGNVTSIGIDTDGAAGEDVEIDFGASRAIVLDLIASDEDFWAAALPDADDLTVLTMSSTTIFGDRNTIFSGQDVATAADDFQINGNYVTTYGDAVSVQGTMTAAGDLIQIVSSVNALAFGDASTVATGGIGYGGDDIIADLSTTGHRQPADGRRNRRRRRG